MKKGGIFFSVTHVATLCVVIFAVSAYFVYNAGYIGYVLVVLGFIRIWSLRVFRINIPSLGPDILFGVIDSGILVVMAIFGGQVA